MRAPETIDFNALLAPIAGENPSGKSLRYAEVYDAIREKRRAEDDLPLGDWQREIKKADWDGAIRLTTEALVGRSKDLQLAVWLVEALVKCHGFAGLRDGIRLLRELQEHFWDSLYPEIEEEDAECRAGPLTWLNEKLPGYIREIQLTEGDVPYTWRHWEESRALDNLGRQNPKAMQTEIAEGKITGEQFDKAVDATIGNASEFYANLCDDLNEAKEQLKQLEKFVDAKFGKKPPSLLNVRAAVDDCHELVSGIVRTKTMRESNDRTDPEPQSVLEDNPKDLNRIDRVDGDSFSSPLTEEPRNREEA